MNKARASEVATQPAGNLESLLRLILDGKVNVAQAKIDQLPVSDDEFTNGYRDALKGIANSLRANDRRNFVYRLKKDRPFLKNEIARLRETEASHLCTEWDLGYFKCWTSYLQGLLSRPLPGIEEKAVEQHPEEQE